MDDVLLQQLLWSFLSIEKFRKDDGEEELKKQEKKRIKSGQVSACWAEQNKRQMKKKKLGKDAQVGRAIYFLSA